MPMIRLEIGTSFGSIEVSGENELEILNMLENLDQDFINGVNEKISAILATQARDRLKGIVAMRRDGPVIVTTKKMTHYEAIGLILYSIRGRQSSSKRIRRRLAASGKKVMVPARIHEMRKRGHVFKPVDKETYYKLSTKGLRWIEEEVLPKLKKH